MGARFLRDTPTTQGNEIFKGFLTAGAEQGYTIILNVGDQEIVSEWLTIGAERTQLEFRSVMFSGR